MIRRQLLREELIVVRQHAPGWRRQVVSRLRESVTGSPRWCCAIRCDNAERVRAAEEAAVQVGTQRGSGTGVPRRSPTPQVVVRSDRPVRRSSVSVPARNATQLPLDVRRVVQRPGQAFVVAAGPPFRPRRPCWRPTSTPTQPRGPTRPGHTGVAVQRAWCRRKPPGASLTACVHGYADADSCHVAQQPAGEVRRQAVRRHLGLVADCQRRVAPEVCVPKAEITCRMPTFAVAVDTRTSLKDGQLAGAAQTSV